MSTPRRAGFTLLELSVVFAILAIAALAVVPAWQQRADRGAGKPADGVLSLLRETRTLAIVSGQTATLRLDPASGNYAIDTAGIAGLGTWRSGTVELRAGERIESDRDRLVFVFRPTGATFADTVRVRNGAAALRITVDAWSGVATIEEPVR